MNEEMLKELVSRIVSEMVSGRSAQPVPPQTAPADCGEEVPDLSAVDFQKVLSIPDPVDAEEYLRIKAKTAARLGVWRAGPRYRSETLLRFMADHAAAMDAVFTDVPETLLEEMGLFSVSTKCRSKDDFLTRPDLGRQFDDETAALIKGKCAPNPDVQVIVADGLSSTAVAANLKDLLPAIRQGLKLHGIRQGTPFFVKYGRVGAEDAVTELVGSKVTVILIGERPGLAFSESLSAYMTYGGYVGIPESARTVISNIHGKGTNPLEAGAHIADVIKAMLEQKASGLDLKL